MASQKVTPYQDQQRSKKEQVEEMFDNIAHQYDFLNHLLSAGIDRSWRNKAIRFLKPFEPKVVMDMATGTGDFAMAALKLNPEKIVGIDLSEQMLSYGRVKAEKGGVADIVEFHKGDSENLDWPDNSFDAITVGFGVRNFENLEAGLGELYRVLRPGGHLVILEITKPNRFPVKQVFEIYFNSVLPLIGKFFSRDERAYSYLPESVAVFPEGTNFVRILEQTGFNKATWKPLTFGICGMYTCEK
jgi:demethylmenaquinone methyltransferase/2-methoxy-6-polyprenyl-1,4-benzoquinol methylase